MKLFKNLVIPLLILLMSLYVFFGVKSQKHSSGSAFVYFVKVNHKGNLILAPVKRKIGFKQKVLNRAIVELFKGPSLQERKIGYFTEIPPKTKLLEIKQSDDKIIINLSKDFATGGGSTSMGMRFKQLKATVYGNVKHKKVYLEINGKKVDSIGGEGVEITQPLADK